MFEEVGKRTTKRTSTFWGWELKLFWELPFFDERLEAAVPSALDATPAPKLSEKGGEGGGEGGDNQQGDEDPAERKIELLRGSPSVKRLNHVSYNCKVREYTRLKLLCLFCYDPSKLCDWKFCRQDCTRGQS